MTAASPLPTESPPTESPPTESLPTGSPLAERSLTEADLEPDGPVTTETWLGAPALSFPHRPASVVAILDRAVRAWPDAVLGVDVATGASATYRDVALRVEATARLIRARGLVPGDAIAVAAGNSTGYAVAILAAARTGTVLVGLSSRLAPTQWAYMLAHSGVRWALADHAHTDPMRAAATEAGLPPTAVADLAEVTSEPAEGWRWNPSELTELGVDEATTYQVVYTSGTTGRPKASQVVHRASVHSAISYQRVLRLQPDESTAVLFSLGYISAVHAHLLPAMLSGARCVFLDPTHPRSWVGALAEHDVAWAYAVPSWWLLAMRERRLDARHLPHLRMAGAGGSAFTPPLLQGLRDRLPATTLLNVYGLSETHSPATMLVGDELEQRPGSVGRPLPCMEVAVRDGDTLADLPASEPGEVFLRGSLVTTGYAGDADATAAAIDAGWLRTGDVGRLDDDGYLYLLDRAKDLVNRAGAKVYSAEVEQVLDTHPAVSESAVVAAPDPVSGEKVAAFVVVTPGAQPPTVPDLRRWVRERISEAASPSVVVVVDELPRGGTGKTDKLALRARLTDANERTTP